MNIWQKPPQYCKVISLQLKLKKKKKRLLRCPSMKKPPANAGDTGDMGLIPVSAIFPGVEMATHSGILACKFHEQRSLVSYIPWGHRELDMTE